MMKVAICGQMYAGKTTVGKYLQKQHNTYFISLDTIVSQILSKKLSIVKDLFEDTIEFCEDTDSNKRQIATRVFNNSALLGRYEKRLYPHIISEVKHLYKQHQGYQFFAVELATLNYLSPFTHSWFDQRILVTAKDLSKFKRIKNSKFSEENLKKRLKLQKDLLERPYQSISNDGTLKGLEIQVDKLVYKLKNQ